MTEETRRLINLKNAKAFIMAGNSTFTLLNTETLNRVTYKVTRLKDERNNNTDGRVPFFVKYLNGPDNSSDFEFIGTIWDDDGVSYSHSRKSRVGENAPSAKGIKFLTRLIHDKKNLPEQFEIWHEGRCGRCGRKLTVPNSIESGYGPDCAGKI